MCKKMEKRRREEEKEIRRERGWDLKEGACLFRIDVCLLYLYFYPNPRGLFFSEVILPFHLYT